jgi:hypothetical protein
MALGLNPSREFFGRIGDDLGQGRMVVGDAQEIVHSSSVVHDGGQFVHEFPRIWSNHLRAENLPVPRLAEQLHKSMGLTGTKGFAMIGERVRSREVRDAPPAAFFFP